MNSALWQHVVLCWECACLWMCVVCYVARDLWVCVVCYVARDLWMCVVCYVASDLWMCVVCYVARDLWVCVVCYVARDLLTPQCISWWINKTLILWRRTAGMWTLHSNLSQTSCVMLWNNSRYANCEQEGVCQVTCALLTVSCEQLTSVT